MTSQTALQNQLVTDIETTADWRRFKAQEYPEDTHRNLAAAEALEKLLQHIESMDADHELFILEQQLINYEDDDLLERWNEDLNVSRRCYGFQDQRTPEEWIDRQVDTLRELIKEYEFEQLAQGQQAELN